MSQSLGSSPLLDCISGRELNTPPSSSLAEKEKTRPRPSYMNSYDDQTKLCLACLAALDGVGPVSIRKLLSAAGGQSEELRRLLDLPTPALQSEFGLARSIAQNISSIDDPLRNGEAVCRRVSSAGGQVLFEGEPAFPSRLTSVLSEKAPPVLFVRGAPAVLQQPTVSIVGSRRPSQAARGAAEELSQALSFKGFTVVSGGAKGIDRTAHYASLRTGSTAVAPATGMLRFRLRSRSTALPPEDAWCVLGHFRPDAGWKTNQALSRNRVIVALGQAVVAFEPRDTGGTWHSSTNALKLGVPLFVVCGSEASAKKRGLRRLVHSGATALDPAYMPDPEAFTALLHEKQRTSSRAQAGLFDSN